MKKIFIGISAVVLALVAYLNFWPVPISPVAWSAPENKGYVDAFAPNTALADLERLKIGDLHGPEDVAMRDGVLYTSSQEGKIVRIDPTTGKYEPVADTGGVPLGIEFDPTGNLIIADAHKGLLSMAPDGTVITLTDSVNGTPILYADDLDIGPNGIIYFSDASTKFGAEASGSTLQGSLYELLEHGRTGRLLAYNPADSSTSIIREGLSFANGVAMGPDGTSVWVNETGEYRVLDITVSGPNTGQTSIVIDNLPGFPDNINAGPDGTYLLGLVSKRSDFLDKYADKPGMRKLALRLPKSIQPKAEDYGFIIHMDADGQIIETRQDPSGAYPLTTGAIIPGDGYMYVSSLGAKTVGRLPYP